MLGVWHHIESFDALDDIIGEGGDILRHRFGIAAHIDECVDARRDEVLDDFWAEAFARRIEQDDVWTRPVGP